MAAAGAEENSMTDTTKFLDQAIPLEGASHSDVVHYSIAIPMRYAECMATLADGRRVPLRDARQLVGWSGPKSQRKLVFRVGDHGVEIIAGRGRRNAAREIHVCQLRPARTRDGESVETSKLVTRDGGLAFVRQTGRAMIKGLTNRKPQSGIGIFEDLLVGAPA